MSGNAIAPNAAVAVSPGLAVVPPDGIRGAKAARDFEARLIGSLLESLEKTFGGLPGENRTPGADNYNYLVSEALAEGIADRGGFGIAAMIARYLAEHEGKG